MKDSVEEGEMKRVTFNRTPIMSTYLLAFVVGDFDYVEARDSNGILVRVYTPVGKKENGRFALEVNWCISISTFYPIFFTGFCQDYAILYRLFQCPLSSA